MASIYRIILLLLFWSSYCQAQIQLTNFYPTSANYHDTLHIVGSGFGSNSNTISVSIGAGKADVITVQDQLIKVVIPSTATFGKVVVTDLINHKSAFFPTPFLPTYHASNFNYTHLNVQLTIINEEAGLYDLCTCDFDQDGDNDIATVNNDEAAKLSSVNVFSNTTTSPDNTSFVKVPGSYFNINQPARNVKCSDVNGDGKPDLIVSQGGTVAENIYVFQNLSTSSPAVIKFASPIILSTAFEGLTKGTRRIEIHDLDGDLKPEIIVTNQTSPVLIIFKNASTNGSIQFPSDQRHFISVPTNTLGLVINDLDGDKLADIITSNNLGSNIYIIKNKSINGSFSFDDPQTIPLSGQIVNLASADMDGDQKQDIVLTDFEDGAIIVLLNTSTSSSLSFASRTKMNAAIQPWGLTLADITGNQLADIIVATQASTDKILVLKNNSIPGEPSFELIQAGYASSYRNVNVADINNDSKPDIVSTERDVYGSNQINYIQNNSCIKVKVFPENPPAICEASPLTLYSYTYDHLNYQWYKDGVLLPGEENANLSVTQAGLYSLRITDPYSSCISTSEDIEIIEDTGAIPEIPSIIAPSQVCAGNDILLTAGSNTALSYFWTGPNDFASTEMNPIISNVSLAEAGEYRLEVRDGLCKSASSSVFIDVVASDKVKVSYQGTLEICPQDSVIFSVNDVDISNIQWYKDNQAIIGEENISLIAKESGKYYVKAEKADACSISSDTFEVYKIALNANFSMSSSVICVSDTLEFSSDDAYSSSVTYQWDYGDGNRDFGKTSNHVYAEAGTYTITHSVILEDGKCANAQTNTITVHPLPEFAIHASSSTICENDTLTLSVSGEHSSFVWEDGSTNNPRQITQEGSYSATAINNYNCSITRTINITQSITPEVLIDIKGKNRIVRGDSIQLFAQGADAYVWQPSMGLSDSLIASPFAKPTQTTSYTVKGFTNEGCNNTAIITIYVDIDEIELDALDIYSPNDDGIEDSWVINNFDEYLDCYFLIFDLQGREVYRSEAPYQNDWKGTNHQGNALPAGVYYYVVRCDDKKNKASGSVTILR